MGMSCKYQRSIGEKQQKKRYKQEFSCTKTQLYFFLSLFYLDQYVVLFFLDKGLGNKSKKNRQRPFNVGNRSYSKHHIHYSEHDVCRQNASIRVRSSTLGTVSGDSVLVWFSRDSVEYVSEEFRLDE